MTPDIWMPPLLALMAAAAWFMSMVAGACLDRHYTDLRGKMWYGCSIIAVEIVVIFGWIAGRYFPNPL